MSATVIELENLYPIKERLKGRKVNLYQYLISDLEDTKNVVSFKDHSLFYGFLEAYKNHKSITLSPDIIWLMIVQGFAYHVAANKDTLRSMFVSFENKEELIVERLDLTPDTETKEDWAGIIDKFVENIGKHTGEQLIDTLEPKFSTTTQASHTAGMVSIMSAMQHYFDYKVHMMGCGFPSITIEGTLEDWEEIQKRVDYISKYNLNFWTTKLTKIINEFIAVKRGNINKEFWLGFFRYKDDNGFYDPSCINGWICKFYPYNKYGKINYGTSIHRPEKELPSEILVTPFVLKLIAINKKVDCLLEAGFMGCKETETGDGRYNVKPIIGWGIKYGTVEKPIKHNYLRYID